MKSDSKGTNSVFIGRYSSRVGAKGRIAVPIKLRDGLGVSAIISQGYEKSLLLMPKSTWHKLTAFLGNQPLTLGAELRDTERFLFGSAFETEFDDQGRMVVPQELRRFAELTDEAIFLGVGNRVEIWSRKNWEIYEASLAKNVGRTGLKLPEKVEGK